ncbi:hypothetical protein P9112_012207 [Eukaryota sp. TZLM1-RC]
MDDVEQQLTHFLSIAVRPYISSNEQAEALTQLETFKQSSLCESFCVSHLSKPYNQASESLFFFCLQCLCQRLEKGIYSDIDSLHRLSQHLFQHFCTVQASRHISSKVCLLLILTIRFSLSFSSNPFLFIQSIVDATPSPSAIYMYLTFYNILDDIVVAYDERRSANEVKVNVELKNIVKEQSMSRSILTFLSSVPLSYATNPSIVSSSLHTLSLFLGWLDVEVSIDIVIAPLDRFVSEMASNQSNDDVLIGVFNCLYELVHKSADDLVKSNVLIKVSCLIFKAFNLFEGFSNHSEGLISAVCLLIAEFVHQIFYLIKSEIFVENGINLFLATVDKLIKYLKFYNSNTSSSMIQGLFCVLSALKINLIKDSTIETNMVSTLLINILSRFQLPSSLIPSNFDWKVDLIDDVYDCESDYDEFLTARNQLASVIKSIFKVCKDPAFRFMEWSLLELKKSLEVKSDTCQLIVSMESVIYLMNCFLEIFHKSDNISSVLSLFTDFVSVVAKLDTPFLTVALVSLLISYAGLFKDYSMAIGLILSNSVVFSNKNKKTSLKLISLLNRTLSKQPSLNQNQSEQLGNQLISLIQVCGLDNSLSCQIFSCFGRIVKFNNISLLEKAINYLCVNFTNSPPMFIERFSFLIKGLSINVRNALLKYYGIFDSFLLKVSEFLSFDCTSVADSVSVVITMINLVIECTPKPQVLLSMFFPVLITKCQNPKDFCGLLKILEKGTSLKKAELIPELSRLFLVLINVVLDQKTLGHQFSSTNFDPISDEFKEFHTIRKQVYSFLNPFLCFLGTQNSFDLNCLYNISNVMIPTSFELINSQDLILRKGVFRFLVEFIKVTLGRGLFSNDLQQFCCKFVSLFFSSFAVYPFTPKLPERDPVADSIIGELSRFFVIIFSKKNQLNKTWLEEHLKECLLYYKVSVQETQGFIQVLHNGFDNNSVTPDLKQGVKALVSRFSFG